MGRRFPALGHTRLPVLTLRCEVFQVERPGARARGAGRRGKHQAQRHRRVGFEGPEPQMGSVSVVFRLVASLTLGAGLDETEGRAGRAQLIRIAARQQGLVGEPVADRALPEVPPGRRHREPGDHTLTALAPGGDPHRIARGQGAVALASLPDGGFLPVLASVLDQHFRPLPRIPCGRLGGEPSGGHVRRVPAQLPVALPGPLAQPDRGGFEFPHGHVDAIGGVVSFRAGIGDVHHPVAALCEGGFPLRCELFAFHGFALVAAETLLVDGLLVEGNPHPGAQPCRPAEQAPQRLSPDPHHPTGGQHRDHFPVGIDLVHHGQLFFGVHAQVFSMHR